MFKMKVSPSLQYHELSEKRIIKLIQQISQIAALSVPNLFNYNGVAVFYIIYSILIITFLMILCIYCLYFKMTTFYSNFIITGVILDTASIIGTTITIIISIAFAVIFRRRKMVQLVKNLKEIEKTLNEKFDSVCHLEDKTLLIQFGCLEAIIFAYMIFDSVFEIRENGFFHYTWSLIFHINIFGISLIVMQVQVIATTIRQYFIFMNDRLWQSMRYPMTRKDDNASNPKFGSIKMKFFLRNYDKLCDVIDLVSKSYGIQIAFIAFIIIVCLIGSLNLIMKFALGNQMVKDGWRVSLLVADTWNSIIYIIFGIILAICCERASNEANNTSVICYKILLDFPSLPKSHYEEVTKNELMLLAEHLSQRKVNFSAAGLFSIDHTMLYMIFGSIAAYLVIVLQFK